MRGLRLPGFVKAKQGPRVRQSQQRLVTRSAGAVCAPRGARSKAFQLEYAVKGYLFKTKEQKSFSAIEFMSIGNQISNKYSVNLLQ